MLKSKFNLAEKQVEETAPEEEHKYESEHVGEAVLEEEKIVYQERILQRSEISIRLSFLGKTADGDGYTYLKAACIDMKLTLIDAIKSFVYLQFVDFSQNFLEIDALQAVAELPHLVLLQADKNVLSSAALNKAKYLQVLILNYNRIATVHDVYQPQLCTLECGYNKIHTLHFENRMPTLKCLDFRYNSIEDISELNFEMLDSLYLAGNKIKSLIGIEKLINLRVLHLRFNPIKSLDGFDACMTKLQYINLRNCKVATLKQVKKLRVLHGIETLVLKGCPYMGGTGEEGAEAAADEEDAELRVEVLATLPRLKRLNKSIVSPEERAEAKDLMTQWLEEGEKEDEEEVGEEHNEEEEED